MKNYHTAKLSLISVMLLAGATTLVAGYIEDREAAVALMRKGEEEAALQAFETMAQGDVTEVQKSDALEQAVLCLIRLKNYDAAKDAADKIPLEGVSDLCRMRILEHQRQPEAIMEKFGDTKIEEWPPMWRGHGYVVRGNAAYQTGHGKLAASDLEEAVLYAATFDNPNNNKTRILNALGATYRDLLKDPDKAVDAFRRAQAMGHGPKSTTATFAIADIYLEQGQPDQAVQVVNDWTAQLRPQNMPGAYWQKYLLASMIRVFTAAGREAEAIAVCHEALGAGDIEPGVKEYARAQLAELQGETTQQESTQ